VLRLLFYYAETGMPCLDVGLKINLGTIQTTTSETITALAQS